MGFRFNVTGHLGHRCAVFIALTLMALGLCVGCRHRPADGAVHLRFWHAWGGYEGKTIEALVDEFNRTHPGIVVEPSRFTIGDKLLASIAGGKPPDIATVWSYMLTPMGESGAFIPLNDYMTSSGYSQKDFLPNVWNYGLYGNERWGVPTTLNVLAVFYVKDAARKAGLDPEHPPETIAELETWSRKMLRRDASGRIETLGFVPTQTDIWMQAFGGSVFDSDSRQFTLDSPENIAAVEWMKQLIDLAGGMSTYRRFTARFGKLDSPGNPLFTGKLAMKEDGQWVIRFFQKFAPDVDYGLFPFPAANAQTSSTAKLDGSFWAIPVGTKHPDEAWTFLSWMIAPKQSARLCASFLNLPPMRATLDEPVFMKVRKDEKFEFFVRALVDGKAVPQPTTPVSEQLYDKLTNGSERVFSGDIETTTMLKQLNDDLNTELERTNFLLGTSPR